MRVALIRGPNLNAWELQTFELLEHEVVAFGTRAGSFAQHGYPVEVRRLPSPHDLAARLPSLPRAGLVHFAGSLEYLYGLEDALSGFDIAHTAELFNPYSLQAVRARKRGRCRRVVVTVWENIALRAPENRLVARRVTEVAAGADHFLALTERSRLYLHTLGVGDDRITVQPMGIDVERFRPDGDARAAGTALEILCVARLVPEKGVEDLLVALSLLQRAGVRARLRLVGSGPLEGRLHAMAEALGVARDVDLGVTLRHDEMPAAYRSADVFVLASGPRTTWREQFGFAIVEAMASGLPVVAGNSGSLPEVVASPDSLVTPHDPHSLADKLAALAADPDERRRQGARNRRWAQERYDRRTVAAAIGALYARVAS